ncbi:hypothetical protein Tco_0003879 [Tanacetum coccineum]
MDSILSGEAFVNMSNHNMYPISGSVSQVCLSAKMTPINECTKRGRRLYGLQLIYESIIVLIIPLRINVIRKTNPRWADRFSTCGIRANGADTVYMSFGAMLKDFIRDDLIELYRLVMQKYGTNRPKDAYDRVLWSDLKTMFDPPLNEDAIWSLPLQQKMNRI